MKHLLERRGKKHIQRQLLMARMNVDQMVNAKNKLPEHPVLDIFQEVVVTLNSPGPPLASAEPICTKRAVPIVPVVKLVG